MPRRRLLTHLAPGRIPAVIVYVLRLRIIIFFISILDRGSNGQFRLRYTDDDLISDTQRRVSGQTRVQRQHLVHIIAPAVGDHRQRISRHNLINLILFLFLGHRIDGIRQRRQLIRIDISLRDLHLLQKIQSLQSVSLRKLSLRHHLDRKRVQLPAGIRHHFHLKHSVRVIGSQSRQKQFLHLVDGSQVHGKFIDLYQIIFLLCRLHLLLQKIIDQRLQPVGLQRAAHQLSHLLEVTCHIRQHQPVGLPGNPRPGIQKCLVHHGRVRYGPDNLSVQKHLAVGRLQPVCISQDRHGAQKRHTASHRRHCIS